MIIQTSFSPVKKLLFTKYNTDNVEMGYGYLIVHERPNGLGKVGLVEDVMVHPEFRRQGVATSIIKEMQKIAKELGLYKVCLFCTDENIPLYSQCGFKVSQNCMRWDCNG